MWHITHHPWLSLFKLLGSNLSCVFQKFPQKGGYITFLDKVFSYYTCFFIKLDGFLSKILSLQMNSGDYCSGPGRSSGKHASLFYTNAFIDFKIKCSSISQYIPLPQMSTTIVSCYCKYIHIYIHIHIHRYIYICIYMYVCVHTHTCIYICNVVFGPPAYPIAHKSK
jgi:hypothetical protein